MILKDLKEINSASSLEAYLNNSFEKAYDFFNTSHYSNLLPYEDDIDELIVRKQLLFTSLNTKSSVVTSFLNLLLDVCQQFGFRSNFKYLFDSLNTSNHIIQKRLLAASIYLTGIKEADDYLINFHRICKLLDEAIGEEEDDTINVVTTIINYYCQAINDFGVFNEDVVLNLKGKLAESYSNSQYSFLNHPLIPSILKIDTSDSINAFHSIKSLRDVFLLGSLDKAPLYSNDRFLIESKTRYSELLKHEKATFNSIRQISVTLRNSLSTDSSRGVKVILEEEDLFTYMYQYGKMHYEKLLFSFEQLTSDSFPKEISIIDWGCGQGLGAMAYLDFLSKVVKQQELKSICLIEPSLIALKRASLNIKKYATSTKIFTINKDINSVNQLDFININNGAKLHIFSNILDIDGFSLTRLLDIIPKVFPGENIFICVSPYITDLKTARLNAFLHHFSSFKEFHLISLCDKKKGEWKNGWSIVQRIFKVNF